MERNAGRLNRHQDGNSGVAGGSNRGFDEDEQDSQDFSVMRSDLRGDQLQVPASARDDNSKIRRWFSECPFLSKAEAR